MAIRTVRVKESILRRSLAEVLADPIPFPKLTKVDETAQDTKDPKTAEEDETTRACEAKAGCGGQE